MDRRYARLILNIVIPAVEILLVCLLGPKLLKFFMPFVIGWIIALIANPLVRFLESRVRLLRKHSSMIIVVAVLALIIGLGYFLVSRLVMQAANLAQDLPVLYDMVTDDLKEISVRFASVFSRLPDDVQANWQELVGNIGHAASLLVQKAASPTVEVAGSVAKGIPNALVNIVVTILSAYFFIAEQDKIMEFWRKHLPESVKGYGHRGISGAWNQVCVFDRRAGGNSGLPAAVWNRNRTHSLGYLQAFVSRLCAGCGAGPALCPDPGHPPGHPA